MKGIRIELKYFEGQPAIQHVARVSKPGRRVYSGAQELPRVRNGLGITIVSTPKGVLSDAEARTQNVEQLGGQFGLVVQIKHHRGMGDVERREVAFGRRHLDLPAAEDRRST